LTHERGTDQYGYAAVNGNFYWVPGKTRFDIKVLEFCDHMEIYHQRKKLAEYKIPPDGVKNKKVAPEGGVAPKYHPRNRKKPTAGEERILRSAAPEIDAYLNFVLVMKGRARHSMIRQLYSLYKKTPIDLFIRAVQRALKYRVNTLATLENIIRLLLRQSSYDMPLPQTDHTFTNRPAYLEGQFTTDPDLSVYKKPLDDNNDTVG